MPQVRIQVLCGPAAVHPHRMGRSAPAGAGDWYAWRLIGANNHELGRSARSFGSYRQALDAFAELRAGADRLVRRPVHDRSTGRWGWRLELGGVAVAASGRWYQRDQDSLLSAAKFVELTAGAEPAESVVALQSRR
ncbi:hypothetical protein GCM10018962_97570 [Dactylosporangium matsuzakiense]|uniref:DUF1508 domain-containing protein n=2 Tax=Dactylosporangium matsuzakiense TaxID=53360 RepID=A0A9W6NMX0_9ACTN|nr:hypothetical protein GCM10017581_046360 [Dactylosporangium matsuzakiense]